MLKLGQLHEEAREISAGVTADNSQLRSLSRRLLGALERGHGDFEATEVSQLFSLCEDLDSNRRFKIRDPEVAEIVSDARKQVLDNLIERFYNNQRGAVGFRNKTGMREINRQHALANGVNKLVCLMRAAKAEDGGSEFGVKWLQLKDAHLYKTLKVELLKKPGGSGIADWEEVKNMLPERTLRDLFVIDMNVSDQKVLLDAASEYKDIAKDLGPEVVAEFLISTGRYDGKNFGGAVRVLRNYVGDGVSPVVGFGDAVKYPPAFLETTSIRRLLFVKLRNYVYRELIKNNRASASTSVHGAGLDSLRADVRSLLGAKGDSNKAAHKALFDEVFEYFDEVLQIKAPERMINVMPNGDTPSMFPSLRQKIAMKEMKDKRRQLISFFMGDGKTAAALLSKEFVGAKKMLLVCPQGELVEEMTGKIEECYLPGKAPVVGIIRSGMSEDELKEVLACEVVVFPYTMLKSKIMVDNRKGGEEKKAIVDIIKEWGGEKDEDASHQVFDFMTVDEVHLAKKLGGTYTEKVFELVDGIPGLYEEGYIASLSGDPVPNSPEDIVPQLRIWDRDTYGEVNSLRAITKKIDPLVTRNAILEYMLLIDEEYDWEQHVEHKDFDLYPEERAIYQAIRNNDDIDLTTKRNLLYLCALNPSWFASEGAPVKSAYLEAMVEDIEEKLETDNAVVIAEAHLRVGVLEDADGRKCLATRIKEKLGEDVNFHVLHGGNKGARKQAFADLKLAAEGGKKTVVFGMQSIVGLGIDLSHVSTAISTSSSFNKADDAQYVMRFPRGANKDAVVTYMRPWDTVLEGYELHAENKYARTQILKYGGVITEDDAALLENDGEMSEAIRVDRGRVLIGSAIVDHTLSPRAKLNKIFAYLHGKGEEVYRRFLEDFGETFAKLYHEAWKNSYGSNNSRFVAGLWKKLEDDGLVVGDKYLDAACGHLVLDSTLGGLEDGRKRNIHSVDLNKFMLLLGERTIAETRPGYVPKSKGGSICDLKKHYSDGQFSALNCSLALNYTRLNTNRVHADRDERVKTLMEYNRVLKPGGVMMLTLPKNVGTAAEIQAFSQTLKSHFGFELLSEYSGAGVSTDNETEAKFENRVITCKKVGEVSLKEINLKSLQLSRLKIKTGGGGDGEGEAPVPNEGVMHTKFALGDLGLEFDAESEEQEEQEDLLSKVDRIRKLLRKLRDEHGDLLKLPPDVEAGLASDEDVKIVRFSGSVFFQFMSAPVNEQKSYTVD